MDNKNILLLNNYFKKYTIKISTHYIGELILLVEIERGKSFRLCAVDRWENKFNNDKIDKIHLY